MEVSDHGRYSLTMESPYFCVAALCHELGVRHAVLSPGSRNIPISLGFYRHQGIVTQVLFDERSAGFVALGLAQSSNKPVVLCCTSGTALLNYGPAVAEAWYQRIPLVVISSDRPAEWIDQWDGQAIHQEEVFRGHHKGFFRLPADLHHEDSRWAFRRDLCHALHLCTSGIPGVVHVNVPIREPLLPSEDGTEVAKLPVRSEDPGVFGLVTSKIPSTDFSDLVPFWEGCSRKIVVLGHGTPATATLRNLQRLTQQCNIPVLSEITSNGHGIQGVLQHHDHYLEGEESQLRELRPDLLITIGKSLLSRKLKKFLRTTRPTHWHLEETPTFHDPFRSLDQLVCCEPSEFLSAMCEAAPQRASYLQLWKKRERKAAGTLEKLQTLSFCDLTAVHHLLGVLPADCVLLLGNSLPVRLANLVGLKLPNVRVYSNRGTGGIDGQNGVAVGHALSSDRSVVLITGDLGFLYDRNAFQTPEKLRNLVVFAINNDGGGIFQLIGASKSLSARERTDLQVCPHHQQLLPAAEQLGFAGAVASDRVTLAAAARDCLRPEKRGPSFLEVRTRIESTQQVFEKLGLRL